MKIMDIRTRQTFDVRPSEDRVFIETRDGVRVRIHPAFIGMTVKRGSKFEGHTNKGPRMLERIS